MKSSLWRQRFHFYGPRTIWRGLSAGVVLTMPIVAPRGSSEWPDLFPASREIVLVLALSGYSRHLVAGMGQAAKELLE